MIEENPLVLIPHEIIPGRTNCRPFRENSNLSRTTRKTTVPRQLPPAPARGSPVDGMTEDGPDMDPEPLAAAYPASAGGAGVCAVCSNRTRAPEHLCLTLDHALKRVAVVLFPSALDASCRASVATTSAFRTIIRAAGVASEPPGDGPGRRISRQRSWGTSVFSRV